MRERRDDTRFNVYGNGGNVERKGDEITKDDLKKISRC